jgi:hypothetical protein
MISLLVNNILLYLKYFPSKIIILAAIILLLFIIKKISQLDVGTKHKIHNFTLNWVFITIYIFYYIVIILYLRYITWGYQVDLNVYFYKFKEYFIANNLAFILLLLIGVVIFLFLVKLRVFLLKELRKRHLYQIHHQLFESIKIYIINCQKHGKKYRPGLHYKPIYNRIIYKLQHFYAYHRVFIRIASLIFGDNYIDVFSRYSFIKTLIKNSHKLLLILILAYDCYFNNFIISKVFYYLPFYILYNVWYNITEFLLQTNSALNRIIYERYYEEDQVLYLRTTKEEEQILENYLRRGLICPSYDYEYTYKFLETNKKLFTWSQDFMLLRRYLRLESPEYQYRYVYENENIGVLGEIIEISKK